ncbi:hypothetical protein MBGDF03_00681 [Thermoplasmatales archaeon SCGC AB-540-F20]|nr:hypothetical protein MBGDF03_00681 [Thermoplasmatales archaeon SCGC AB-540-F20]
MAKTILEEVDRNQPEAVVGKIVTGDKVVDATTENIEKVKKGKKNNPKSKMDPLLERSNTIKRDEFFDSIVKEFPDTHIKMVTTSNPDIQEPVLYYGESRILQGAVSGKYWWSAYEQTKEGRNIVPVFDKKSEKGVHNFIQTRVEEIDKQTQERLAKKQTNDKPKKNESKKSKPKLTQSQEREKLVGRMGNNTSSGINVSESVDVNCQEFIDMCQLHNWVYNPEDSVLKQG